MNNIQKVIEESDKEFYGLYETMILDSYGSIFREGMKSFISQRDQKILTAIEAEVEGLPNLRIESIDHEGRKMLWQGLTNKSDIQEIIKSAK